MNIPKILGIVLLAYVAIVVIFESLLGYYQPAPDGTMMITTTHSDGTQANRVLSKLQSEGVLYAAANHWPRAWFHQAKDNPQVSVTIDEQTRDYVASEISGAEFDRVNGEHALPTFFRILTGFPPRYILRLEAR